MSKEPLDRRRYRRDPRSQTIRPGIADGTYVYVLSEGEIWVLHDGPHAHPRVLGGARPADYAGDLTIAGGMIQQLTNLSGTFQFDDPEGLRLVAQQLKKLGFELRTGAVRFFPIDGTRPHILE
jgi:hypothetical protein